MQLHLDLINTVRFGRQAGANLPQPLVIREIGRNYVWINPAFFQRFGYSLADLQSHSFQDLWGVSPQLQVESDGFLLESNAPQVFAHRIIDPSSAKTVIHKSIDWMIQEAGRLYRSSMTLAIVAAPELGFQSINNQIG